MCQRDLQQQHYMQEQVAAAAAAAPPRHLCNVATWLKMVHLGAATYM
jgi:hypothetical protein